MILLDTHVVSELMRPQPAPQVQNWLALQGGEPLATSAVSVAEIVFGLVRLPAGKRRADLIERFEALIDSAPALPVLTLDQTAGRWAGEFRALREGAGQRSSPSDMLIAGIAMANGARLATRNVADFTGLPISVMDPWS